MEVAGGRTERGREEEGDCGRGRGRRKKNGENVKAIKVILMTFELVSSLKINFAKSCFGAFGVTDQWKQAAVNYLNCSLLAFPFVYLGIPLSKNVGQPEAVSDVGFHYPKM